MMSFAFVHVLSQKLGQVIRTAIGQYGRQRSSHLEPGTILLSSTGRPFGDIVKLIEEAD
jgi:hypothetical protein